MDRRRSEPKEERRSHRQRKVRCHSSDSRASRKQKRHKCRSSACGSSDVGSSPELRKRGNRKRQRSSDDKKRPEKATQKSPVAAARSRERRRKQPSSSCSSDGKRPQPPVQDSKRHKRGKDEEVSGRVDVASKDRIAPQELNPTQPESAPSVNSRNSKPLDSASSHIAGSADPAKPTKQQAKILLNGLGDVDALKQRLEQERNRLSVLKEHQEWEQHKEAERNVEVREKEYFQAGTGEVIGPEGKLKILDQIGRGHFANVFRCKDVNSGEEYAVKILRSSSVIRKAAEQEVDICRLVHDEARRINLDGIQNIVSLLGPETFEHSGHLCLVFNLLRYDLRRVSEKLHRGNGLPAASVQRYGTNLFSALRLLHRLGIVHTDIKPDNLLVSCSRDRRGLDFIQLIDFGNAKRLDINNGAAPEGITFTGYVSPRFYRAPEVFLGQSYGTQVDIWGAGATLFEMATGRILFDGDTSNAMLHSILQLSGEFPVMFSTRGQNSMKHFSKTGEFLQTQDERSAQKIPMSHFAQEQQPFIEDLEKFMRLGKPEPPPDVLVRRIAEVIKSCLVPDPIHRITAEGGLKLEFFKKGSQR